jgi:hypothetical protein
MAQRGTKIRARLPSSDEVGETAGAFVAGMSGDRLSVDSAEANVEGLGGWEFRNPK